jgi:HlyD family secretion protein
MDRPIDDLQRRRRLGKRAGMAAGAVGALVLLAGAGPRLLRPSLARERIRTARVDRGPVEATLTASGTVVPEVEQVISSPVDARVLRIRKRPGDVLARGEVIVELDLSASRLAVEKLGQDLALKDNQQARTRLDLEARLAELEGQRKVKALELRAQKSRTARDRDLFRRGFLSPDELSQSEVAEARAGVELEQLETEIRHAGQSTRTQVQGLALERATLQREREEARRLLELATTRADRKAVLTWTVTEEGAAVKKGDVIARLADLSSFRVDGTLSDVHAQRLRVGQPVVVAVNDRDHLPGTIATINPTIRDGAMAFSVALAPGSRASPLLRPSLRVDVLVVTGKKDSALRLARGPFADGEGLLQVFVVRGDRAVRAPVRMGLVSAEHVEVLEGLAAGDEAIISDMTPYLHLPELRIR